MNDDFTARQAAISLRLAGRSVKHICSTLGRCQAWFHKWWRRYLEDGPEGLSDRTRANHQVTRRIPPELERAILSIRRRLQAHASPATRYSLIRATVTGPCVRLVNQNTLSQLESHDPRWTQASPRVQRTRRRICAGRNLDRDFGRGTMRFGRSA